MPATSDPLGGSVGYERPLDRELQLLLKHRAVGCRISCSWKSSRTSPSFGCTLCHLPRRSSVHAEQLSDSARSSTSFSCSRSSGAFTDGQRLDAPVEVARHHVGAADVDLLVAAVPEVEDARVLEEPPQDASARVMFLLSDFTPGRSVQMLRTIRSTLTPCSEAL